MLVPSAAFIAQLSFAKIPDRKYFINLAPATPLKYWQMVLKTSEFLAEEFSACVAISNTEHIKLIE
jgi:hypothetical protein